MASILLTGNRLPVTLMIGKDLKYTISDIAKLSSVSKATVSRVINGSKPVSFEIKTRVLKVIKETHYQPSQVARSLLNKQTKLIGVIVPDFTNTIFASIIGGIELEALKYGYNIILCNSMHNETSELKYLDVLMDKEVDGLIYNGFKITNSIRNKLSNFSNPIVMIGIDEVNLNYPVVKINNFQAAYDATLYLIKSGHRKIGMIHGSIDDPFPGKLRLNGFIKAMEDNNLPIITGALQEGDYTVSSGYRAMEKILAIKNIPTCIFCANDTMAIGSIKCVIDSGKNIPNDISVMGFDDIEMSSIFSPSITTVHQPFRKKGISALNLLMKIIKNEEFSSKIEHRYKIITRETVKVI